MSTARMHSSAQSVMKTRLGLQNTLSFVRDTCSGFHIIPLAQLVSNSELQSSAKHCLAVPVVVAAYTDVLNHSV